MRSHLFVMVFVMVFAAACAPVVQPRPVTAANKEKPPMTVAVIEFGVEGAEAEKGCVAAVLDAGFRALEPSGTDVDAALQSAGVVDYVKLGKTLGAELILDGGVPRAGLRSVQLPPRLISPVSNDVLATAKSKLHLHHGAPEGKNACARLLLQLP